MQHICLQYIAGLIFFMFDNKLQFKDLKTLSNEAVVDLIHLRIKENAVFVQ